MKIDILTLFPEMFDGPFGDSIIKKALDKGIAEIKAYNLRDWTTDKHKMVDDRPYGGGPGMVLMIEPIDRAIAELKKKAKAKNSRVIMMDPAGRTFNQKVAEELKENYDHLILIAGHYKGIDERVRDYLVDEEISVGDYILTGGEIPAMVIADAVVRLLPGTVGKEESLKKESFSDFDTPGIPRMLGFVQYTRPVEYKGWKVPNVLLKGNHAEIEKWRINKSLERTRERRPDLLE